MESNKDEALRCVKIAESALASGDKQRALKFIRIARRLDDSLSLEELVEACEKLKSADSSDRREAVSNRVCEDSSSSSGVGNGDRGYTDEHVKVIREIRTTKDYYAILGVEKGCTVDEIRKAYRKLSLKVHPDKNKAPGAEEAFKSVCKAFKCLSDDQSRQNYDQTGAVEDYEFNEQHGNVRRRRRRTTASNNFFDEDFDPDEIFRSFFFGTPNDVFRAQPAYRERATGRQYRENDDHAHRRADGGGAFNMITLLQILPIVLFFLFAFVRFDEPEYSLQKTYAFQIPKVTVKHGVQYFVKSEDFEQQFPQGSSARDNFEENVVRDYKSHLGRYCHIELQRRQWSRNYPTPHCDKLRSLGVVW